MDEYTSHELAYKKGYEQGKQDAMKWIPVTERLPEIVKTSRAWKNVYRKSERVLCACLQKDGKRMVKEGYMEFFNDYPEPSWIIPGTIDSVTHWMPLPTPPKEVLAHFGIDIATMDYDAEVAEKDLLEQLQQPAEGGMNHA